MNKNLEACIFQAILIIILYMDEKSKIEVMNKSENLHFGLGTWIRNTILTVNSEIYLQFINNGYEHKDDMSAIIIDRLYNYLCNSK